MRHCLAMLATLLLACSSSTTEMPDASVGDAATQDDATAPLDADTPGEYVFTTLEDRTLTVLQAQVRVELVRATRPDGAHTYLQYAHSAFAATNAPLVVVNQPYQGINWTGEEVDARWAQQGAGAKPDVDAPDYDGDDVTAYTPVTVQQAADDCVVWLVNGFACVEAYGRYYAGGTLVDDALDAAAAYHFALSRSAELDLTRIGAWGASWGGMMTLQGAARAPQGARPRTIVALAPPSDFIDLARWTDVDLPAVYPMPANAEAFFSPYWRRIAPDLGRIPTANAASLLFRPEGLCPALPSDTWVLHDDWDTLIPVRQTEALQAACSDRVHGIYWRRQTPINYADIGLDHGAFGREPGLPTVYAFATSRIASSLVPPSATQWVALAHGAALQAFLGVIHEAQINGDDTSYALVPVRTLAEARASLFDPIDSMFHPGGDVVAAAVNAVWGTTYDAAGVRAALAVGWPAP